MLLSFHMVVSTKKAAHLSPHIPWNGISIPLMLAMILEEESVFNKKVPWAHELQQLISLTTRQWTAQMSSRISITEQLQNHVRITASFLFYKPDTVWFSPEY